MFRWGSVLAAGLLPWLPTCSAGVTTNNVVMFQWQDVTCASGSGIAADEKVLVGGQPGGNYALPGPSPQIAAGVEGDPILCNVDFAPIGITTSANTIFALTPDIDFDGDDAGGSASVSDLKWGTGHTVTLGGTNTMNGMTGNCHGSSQASVQSMAIVSNGATGFGSTSLGNVVRVGWNGASAAEVNGGGNAWGISSSWKTPHAATTYSYLVHNSATVVPNPDRAAVGGTEVTTHADIIYQSETATIRFATGGTNAGLTTSRWSLQAEQSTYSDTYLTGRAYHAVCGADVTSASTAGTRILATAGILMYRQMQVGVNDADVGVATADLKDGMRPVADAANYPQADPPTVADQYACPAGNWLYFEVKVGTGTNVQVLDNSHGTAGAPQTASNASVCHRIGQMMDTHTTAGGINTAGTSGGLIAFTQSGVMTCNSGAADVSGGTALDNQGVHMSFSTRAHLVRFLEDIAMIPLTTWQANHATAGLGDGATFYPESVRVEPVWTYDCQAIVGRTGLSHADVSAGFPTLATYKGKDKWDKLGYLKVKVSRPTATMTGDSAAANFAAAGAGTADSGVAHAKHLEFIDAVTASATTVSACTALLNDDGMFGKVAGSNASTITAGFVLCKSAAGAADVEVELWYVPAYITSGTADFLGAPEFVNPKMVDHLAQFRTVLRDTTSSKADMTTGTANAATTLNWLYKVEPVSFKLAGKRTSDDAIPFVTYTIGGELTGTPAASADLQAFTYVSHGFHGHEDKDGNAHSDATDLCMAIAMAEANNAAVACVGTAVGSATLYYVPLTSDGLATGVTTGADYSTDVFGVWGGKETGADITMDLQYLFSKRPTDVVNALVKNKTLFTMTATDYHWVTFSTVGLFSPFTTSGQTSAAVGDNFFFENSACRALIMATGATTDANIKTNLRLAPFSKVVGCSSDATSLSLAFINQKMRDDTLALLPELKKSSTGDMFGKSTRKDKLKMAPKPTAYAHRGVGLVGARAVEIYKVTVGQKQTSATPPVQTAWVADADDTTYTTRNWQGRMDLGDAPCKYWVDQASSSNSGAWCGYSGAVIEVVYVGTPETEVQCGNLVFAAGVGKPSATSCDPYHGKQTTTNSVVTVSNPQHSRTNQLRNAMVVVPSTTWPVPFSIADADNGLARVTASFYHGASATSTTLDTAATTGTIGIADSVCGVLKAADTNSHLLACKQTGVTPDDSSKLTLFYSCAKGATAGLRSLAAHTAVAVGLSHIKPSKVQLPEPMSAWTKSTPKFKAETDIFAVKMATTAAQATATKWTDMTNRLSFAGSACEVINTDFTGGSAASLAYPIWCHHPDSCNACDVEVLFLNEDPFLAASDTSGYAGLRTSWQAFLQDEQYDNAATPAVKQQKFRLEAQHKSLYAATLAATLSGTTLAPTTRRSLLTVPNGGLTQAYGKPETDSLCKLVGYGTNVLSCASGTGASPTLTAYFASRADRATVLAAWAIIERKPLTGANGLKDLVPTKLVDHSGTESKIIKLCIEGKGPLTDGVSKWGAESTGLGTANSACGTFSASGAIHCVAKECNNAAAGERQLNTVVSATQQIELSFARGASTDETADMYAGFQSQLSSGSTYQFTILKVDGSVSLSLEYETSLPLYSSTTHKPMVASLSGAVNGVADSACEVMGHSRITKALTCSSTAVTAATAGTTILSFGTLAGARTGAQEMHATAVNGVGMALTKYAGVAPRKSDLSFTAVKKVTKSTTRKYDQAGICAALAALKGDSLPVATFVECHVAAEVAKDATGNLELVYLTADDAAKAANAWLDKGKTEATVLAFAKDATLSGAETTISTVAGGGGDGSITSTAKPTGTNTTASIRVVGLALAAWCSVLVFG